MVNSIRIEKTDTLKLEGLLISIYIVIQCFNTYFVWVSQKTYVANFVAKEKGPQFLNPETLVNPAPPARLELATL